MAINRDFAGRTFPVSEPYEVSRVKIADFASAIGDPNPVYRDRAAARAAGHPDVIAPPTFAIVISMASAGMALADPVAGDVLTAQPTITEIRDAGRNVMLTTSTEIKTVEGELVCTALGTLVERGM